MKSDGQSDWNLDRKWQIILLLAGNEDNARRILLLTHWEQAWQVLSCSSRLEIDNQTVDQAVQREGDLHIIQRYMEQIVFGTSSDHTSDSNK